MSAFVLDWDPLAEWFTALAAVGALIVAIWAARSWQEQLRGGSKHTVAQEVAAAARALKYAFYVARSPLIEGWKFPET